MVQHFNARFLNRCVNRMVLRFLKALIIKQN